MIDLGGSGGLHEHQQALADYCPRFDAKQNGPGRAIRFDSMVVRGATDPGNRDYPA
jgi:hypothetical protein